MALLSYKSLRVRINALILIVCTSVAVLTLIVAVPFERQRRANRLHDIKVLVNAVYHQKKEAIANEFFAEQLVALGKSLEDMQSVKHIEWIELYRLDGTFMLATNDLQAPSLSGDTRKKLLTGIDFSKQSIDGHPYGVYQALIEIIGEKVGYIRILYDLSEMEQESHVVAYFLLTLLVAALIVGGLMANLLLTNTIIRPTMELSKAIRKVRQGALGERVRIDSEDEIGSMAADFNEMSERLRLQHENLVQAIQAKDSYAEQLKVINRELETLNKELEQRVGERTKELEQMYEQLEREIIERKTADDEKKQLQEQLARSQKMEALGLLAGGVAHDLNNVLSGIVSYPDLLLLKLEENNPLRKPIETIQKSGQKASAIVQDLLTLARRSVISKEVVNLNDLVTAYLEAPEHLLIMHHHSGIAIYLDLAKDLMPILASPFHITKTIMNLVSNAVEAQADGGQITISTRNRYLDRPLQRYERISEGEYALLSIADTGSGIADDDLQRIFEPFYTKKVLGHSGTGLGMAVVWGTVQDHNGYIHVQSAPGKGTIFELYFPISRQSPGAVQEKTDIQSILGDGETILVVDDMEAQREITWEILNHLNYHAVTVSSGEKAVDYIKQQSVPLIILDMIMDQGIDGLETYRQIKKINPAQKAIIASGFAESNRVREALALGAGAYIRKPFTLDQLGLAIRRELKDF
jgi:signal transduction histidine kinase/ActR/RegA family two-component response regulator